MMKKYYARVTLVKEFEIKFPEELFTEEHMDAIRSYSSYYKNLTEEQLRDEIAEAWADGGDGYYEQFGCFIGWQTYSPHEGQLYVEISYPDTDIDDVYLSEV